MIGRALTAMELDWLFSQSERLRALLPLTLGAHWHDNAALATHLCALDSTFASLASDWQLLIVADIHYLAGVDNG